MKARLSDLQFFVATNGKDNQDELRQTLTSIIKQYPTASILVGDATTELDRAFYKELRRELTEAGMVNRLVAHHLPYNMSELEVFNKMMGLGAARYALLLTSEDRITEETDVMQMLRIVAEDESVGVITGKINGKGPEIEGRSSKTEDDDRYGPVKTISRFMLIRRDIRHSLRFNVDKDDPLADFMRKAPTAIPYKIVTTDVSIISGYDDINNETETEKSDGDSGGESPERDLSSEAGGSDTENGSDDTSASERKDETSEDPAPRRRSSRGRTRSVPGDSDE